MSVLQKVDGVTHKRQQTQHSKASPLTQHAEEYIQICAVF